MSANNPNRSSSPFTFSKQQIQRLQQILDTNGSRPADLAEDWGISVSAANKDVARMRVKAGANSMAELLIKAQRAGAITMTYDPARGDAPLAILSKDDLTQESTPENVYCRVLDNTDSPYYNVPMSGITRFARMNLVDRTEQAMTISSTQNQLIRADGTTTISYRDFHRIDDPDLAVVCAERRERNNCDAVAIGLPAVGSTMLNEYGTMWRVDGHVHAATPNTIHRWRHGAVDLPDDLYPSVVPQNLSDRLTNFIAAVDHCTSKSLIFLDTTPELRPMAVRGSNSIDTISDPRANLIFLDAARAHETVLAHEVGHAWVQYVEECEDLRVLEDVSDAPRLHQFNFVQSFVLDLKVNDLIRRKGFDMSPIDEDQIAAIISLLKAIEVGYAPPNEREEVLMALLLATQLLDDERTSHGQALVKLGCLTDNLARLSKGFADAVRTHGYQDLDSIQASIDECLLIAFDHTGDHIDLEKGLVVPETHELDFDKYPHWIEGAPVALKVEVGRIMAREDIPLESRWRLTSVESQTLLEFERPDGGIRGSWLLNHPYPFQRGTDILRLMEINRQNRERIMDLRRPTPHTPGFPNTAGWPPLPGSRHYMAGLGRFLTQARLEEQLRGEQPYVYALNNPVSYADPSGLLACSVGDEEALGVLGMMACPAGPCPGGKPINRTCTDATFIKCTKVPPSATFCPASPMDPPWSIKGFDDCKGPDCKKLVNCKTVINPAYTYTLKRMNHICTCKCKATVKQCGCC